MYAKLQGRTEITIKIEEHNFPFFAEPRLIPLCNFSFSLYKVSKRIQHDMLQGKYYTSVSITDSENFCYKDIIDPDIYKGKLFNCRIIKADPKIFTVHPTTFVRLCLFWKLAKYIPVKLLNHPLDDEFDSYVWGQWLVFNRLRVSEL